MMHFIKGMFFFITAKTVTQPVMADYQLVTQSSSQPCNNDFCLSYQISSNNTNYSGLTKTFNLETFELFNKNKIDIDDTILSYINAYSPQDLFVSTLQKGCIIDLHKLYDWYDALNYKLQISKLNPEHDMKNCFDIQEAIQKKIMNLMDIKYFELDAEKFAYKTKVFLISFGCSFVLIIAGACVAVIKNSDTPDNNFLTENTTSNYGLLPAAPPEPISAALNIPPASKSEVELLEAGLQKTPNLLIAYNSKSEITPPPSYNPDCAYTLIEEVNANTEPKKDSVFKVYESVNSLP